jgi:hypothetical protein
MEPLPLAVRVLACHHFAKGSPTAVAILWLFGIIIEILFLNWRVEFRSIHLHLLPLEDLLLGLLLVLVLELGGQEVLVLHDLAAELVRDVFLLLGVSVDLLLFLEDGLVVCSQSCWHLHDFLLLELFDLRDKFGVHGDEGGLDVFDAFVEFADESKVAVDVVGDGDHFVHEVIEVGVGHRGFVLIKYYKNLSIGSVIVFHSCSVNWGWG